MIDKEVRRKVEAALDGNRRNNKLVISIRRSGG
jgi:hypothetical protein